MTSNFQFLKAEFSEIHEVTIEAEQFCLTIPRHTANLCRIALESALHWMYEFDPELEVPYDKTLHSLLTTNSFRSFLPAHMQEKLHYIRKLGNLADHSRQNIRREESLISIQNLHSFLQYFARSYAEEDFKLRIFDETVLPASLHQEKSKMELKRMKEALEASIGEIERLKVLKSENDAEIQRLKRRDERVLALKKDNEDRAGIPVNPNEAHTRKFYIDLLIKEAGWDLEAANVLECPVVGMPKETNPTGDGYADYVLWGNDGLPLAVIEAKRTIEDAKKGQRQAELYANCLENMTGQRPVIFYSNGYETFLWDDTNYPPRQVHGLYTREELQTLINRRKSKKVLTEIIPDKRIAGRFYQIEAIKRVVETLQKENKRKALLVMATGTGKTRLATALVDVLARANWVKRALFLADRNALVAQGKNKFSEFLINLPMVDLTKDKENTNSRLVFSTYPTMMNLIDGKEKSGGRFYGVGHFDLIIVDEAHRSVYNKYQGIFDYFDAMMIGLTATPKGEVDHNTYNLFDVSDGNPTFAYELNTAVNDRFLTRPKAMSVPIKFPREGIKYHELSEEEKEKYEATFLDEETGELIEEIDAGALNEWLFNSGTVDVVLSHLMEHGIKVEGGDKLGKTIIFAKSQRHAEFIEERFNKMYPEHKGKFLRIITYKDSKAASTLADFSDKNKQPQIAVSVDMLDTGIDIPEIVNLVFFKRVKSSAKFWQMIGRGTRLCKDLFAPGKDKEEFFIFDFCENFEFFNENPEGINAGASESISQKIFKLKLRIAEILKEEIYLGDAVYQQLRKQYLDALHNDIAALNRESFQVRKQLRYVDQFNRREVWERLTTSDVATIDKELSHLPVITDNDELAKRFDLLMHNLQHAMLEKLPAQEAYINNVVIIAKGLSKKLNIPVVALKKGRIKELQQPEFWKQGNFASLDKVREELRELVKFIEKNSQKVIYSDLIDEIKGEVVVHDLLGNFSTMPSYKLRVEKYLREHKDNLAIQRIRKGEVLTKPELEALEHLMFGESDLGTKEEFQKAYGEEMPLTYFIRNLLGFDAGAAKEAFGEFLDRGNLTADQITFINNIIDHLTTNGVIDKGMLFEPPFTYVHDDGALGIFPEEEATRIFSIVDQLNEGLG